MQTLRVNFPGGHGREACQGCQESARITAWSDRGRLILGGGVLAARGFFFLVAVLAFAALTGCASRPLRDEVAYNKAGDIISWERIPMTNAEAKAAGYSFLQRNAYLPWFYPFALLETLNQIGN